MEKLFVVQVRSTIGSPKEVKETLKLLNLHRPNNAVIVNKNPNYLGMLKKVKDLVTWGEINEETFKFLVEKRSKPFKGRLNDKRNLYKYNYLEMDGKKIKPYFALNPPRKGYGRKGIKVAFKTGGALGYRGEKINDLIMRML